MKIFRGVLLLLGLALLTACGQLNASSVLPTVVVSTTRTPDVAATLRAFLDAEMVEDYSTMYSMLSQASQTSIKETDFKNAYVDALENMTVSKMEYSIESTLTNPQTAEGSFHIVYHTALFGDLARDIKVNLVLENHAWRIQWDRSMILPELAGGKSLSISYAPAPSRGDILDRNGNTIATQTAAVSLGVDPGKITSKNEDAVLRVLSALTGIRPTDIQAMYTGQTPGQYVAIGETSAAQAAPYQSELNALGILQNPYTSRYYFDANVGIAPQTVGNLLYINPSEEETYKRLGYRGDERIGAEGIEAWGEPYLHGRTGATLSVVSADGSSEQTLASSDPEPGDSITLTLDMNLQEQAQAAMDGLPGAIVVMQVDTGQVLAMVSSPAIDSNWWDPADLNYTYGLPNVVNSPESPATNRATTGLYPLGSVFKIVTMAAALESGMFTPSSTLNCQYYYTELVPFGGPTLTDWTYEYCQDEEARTGATRCPDWPPSGELTLDEGLMRSCDPWFYHIGFTLFNAGKTTAISDMAHAFGLGETTGIAGVDEEPGQIPVPGSLTEATSDAIGQGNTLVTPLQVADFIAAVANGGTLYTPQLVEQIQPVSGAAFDTFNPEKRGVLPISAATLASIQQSMVMVADNPRGTAYDTLGTFAIPTAGKTGTAESGTSNSEAWFAGYSLAGMPNKPDIAVAVVVENQNDGEGAIWALPIFRRIMEIYFYGQPQTIYPWEKNFGVINPNYGQVQPTPTPTPAH